MHLHKNGNIILLNGISMRILFSIFLIYLICRLSQKEQETVIGRTKGENSQKVRPLDPRSHLARTDLKENGIDIKVVRQSLPYGGMKEHGLFFISYASNPHKHEKQLNSMIGFEDGIQDQLMNFSTPITGNYWFIPSIRLLKTFFNLI